MFLSIPFHFFCKPPMDCTTVYYFGYLFHWFRYLLCSAESQEVLDAELSARILQLINVTDNGLHSQVSQHE